MKRFCIALLALLSLAFISLPGCPQKAETSYSIDSFAISSQEHVFSKSYTLFLKLSGEAFNSSSTLIILQDGSPLTEFPLTNVSAPPGNELSLPFFALEVGEHELTAVIRDGNGTAISNEKTLPLNIIPLGFYDFGDEEKSYQVEPTVWCAQEFTLDNNASLSEIALHLRSPLQTRPGKRAILELRTPAGGFPGTAAENLIMNSTIPSDSFEPAPDWHSFPLTGEEFPAGTYWIVLRRDDTVGNVAWTYSNESTEGRAFCRDFSSEAPWAQVAGGFAFRIQ